MSISRKLEDKIDRLSPELKKEVEDFVEFLLDKRNPRAGKKLSQSWAGALRNYKDQYTAMELQKKALEWRTH